MSTVNTLVADFIAAGDTAVRPGLIPPRTREGRGFRGVSTSKPSKKWPFCPAAAEHGRMVPYEPATPEQAFCIEDGGRWLKCTKCTSSIVEQGSALKSFLATFKKSA